ncbi:MAG: hypothetical protein H0T92_21520 [Pyrinomonadaceae bacterium]|jgi:hypothetical protein|nr:hypothetical protein [Pyrinomonadaceae bacterium]
MLAKNEALQREFERRLVNDPKFASSARKRPQFFYDRSSYNYSELNRYPVARLNALLQVKVAEF